MNNSAPAVRSCHSSDGLLAPLTARPMPTTAISSSESGSWSGSCSWCGSGTGADAGSALAACAALPRSGTAFSAVPASTRCAGCRRWSGSASAVLTLAGVSTGAATWAGASRLAPRVSPPSARITWPVIQLDSSEARKATSRANSSGVPRRPSGVPSITACCMAAASGNLSATSLASIAAEAMFTLMFCGANSTAR